MQGIYMIKNLSNNKVYIGQSTDINMRWKWHIKDLFKNRHHNAHLMRAWYNYGKDNFEFTILEFIDDISLLEEKEQYWMDFYQSLNRKYGYNIRPASKHSPLAEETKIKISEKCKQYKLTDEQRKKLSISVMGKKNGMYGKHHSEETKQKISQSKKNKPGPKWSEERKQQYSKNITGEKNPMFNKEGYWKNKHLSEETKQKISDKHKNTKMCENTKKALEQSRQNRINSGEYFSQEVREKLSKIHKGKNKSQEHKDKISQVKIYNNLKKYEDMGKSLINEDIVQKIINDLALNLSKKNIIEKYNITYNLLYKIIEKKDLSMYFLYYNNKYKEG